jgi:hypothetical protein
MWTSGSSANGEAGTINFAKTANNRATGDEHLGGGGRILISVAKVWQDKESIPEITN